MEEIYINYELGFGFAFNWKNYSQSKIGLGFSLSYDGSINAQVAVDEGELEVSHIQSSQTIFN